MWFRALMPQASVLDLLPQNASVEILCIWTKTTWPTIYLQVSVLSRPGLTAAEKGSSCSCSSPCLISLAFSLWHASCLLPRQSGGHSSGSELLLHTFPLLMASRAAQIFILEFNQDVSTELGGKFADGASANQPLIGVGLSSGQVSQRYCQFLYLFIWGFTSLSSLYRSYHGG